MNCSTRATAHEYNRLLVRCNLAERQVISQNAEIAGLRRRIAELEEMVNQASDREMVDMVNRHAMVQGFIRAWKRNEAEKTESLRREQRRFEEAAKAVHSKAVRKNILALSICALTIAVTAILGYDSWIHPYIAQGILYAVGLKVGYEVCKTVQLLSASK